MSLIATSQDDVASTLGIDTRTFQRWIKRGCPGKPRNYVLHDIIQWARENVWAEEATIIESATGNPSDPRTQYLIERTAKIRRENIRFDMELEAEAKRLVDAEQVRDLLSRQASVVRQGLEKLERKYGPEALDMVLEVIQEAETIDLGQPAEA